MNKIITLSPRACKRWGIKGSDRFVQWGQNQAWAAGETPAACEADLLRVAGEAGVDADVIRVNSEVMRIRRSK